VSERMTRVDLLRSWTDQIPLRYEYTAGVAGEKFFRGLKRGKVLAGACDKCGAKYVPPKAYCVNCFTRVSKFVEVGPEGRIGALSESHVEFDGSKAKEPKLVAFVTFKGTTGGLIHRVEGHKLRIGARVRPRFVPESERKGSLLDIAAFEAV